jgi:putative Ca2+/H+ antiporter (TMEM165/GDT1 family)
LGGSLLCSFSPALGLWVRQNPGATQLLGWILFVFWQWIGLIVPPEVALLIWETIGLAVSLALLAKLRLPRQRKLVALAVWFVVFGLRLWRHQPTISQIKFVALSGVGYNNTQPA